MALVARLLDACDRFILSLWSATTVNTRDRITGLSVIAVFIIIVFSAIAMWPTGRQPLAPANVPHSVVRDEPGPSAEATPLYMAPGRGTKCIDSYTNREDVVLGTLSRHSKPFLFSQRCETQRKVLDLLSRYPRDQRDEVMAQLMDVTERRQNR